MSTSTSILSDPPSAAHGASEDTRPFQILALDGGGFRGFFTAVILAIWESQLGRPIASFFDLLVGTSTGGILALALAAGRPAAELVDFYVEDGRHIFPAQRSWWRRWASLRHWIAAKYDPAALEAALKRRLGDITTLGDLAAPVVVPAYNLQDGKHWYFKTPHFSGNTVDRLRPLWEVARATSAAPTYFPVFESSNHELFVDGGVLANNPALVGYFEVLLNFPAHASQVRILNIGTEGGECQLPRARLRRGGILQWGKSAPEVILQAQASSTESLMRRLLGPDAWLRVMPEHGRSFAALDVYAPELYRGMATSAAARAFGEAEKRFFRHTARTGLVQQKAQIS